MSASTANSSVSTSNAQRGRQSQLINVELKMLHALCDQNRMKDVLFSPLCLRLSLSFLFVCATGQTAEEIRTMLMSLGSVVDDVVVGSNNIMSQFRDSEMIVEILAVVDPSVTFKGGFLEMAKMFENVTIEQRSSATRQLLSSAFSKFFGRREVEDSRPSIGGRLSRRSADSLTGVTMEMFVSIHLKAKIETVKSNSPTVAFRGDHEESMVQTMRILRMLRILESRQLKATIVEVPLLNGEHFFLYLILPPENGNIYHTQIAMYNFFLGDQLSKFRSYPTDLTLPKFEIDCLCDLKHLLCTHGVVGVFDKDTCELSEATDVKMAVGSMPHKARIQFVCVQSSNEEDPFSQGRATFRHDRWYRHLSQTRQSFMVDRPFLFLVAKHVSNRNVVNVLVGQFSNKPKD